MLGTFIDLVLHLDAHLAALALQMGPWTYVILFAIIFAETGLIVAPILPGDSLLFAAGSVAALPDAGLDVKVMWISLIAAAVIGDNLNYTVGRWIGPRIFNRRKSIFLNPNHLRRTHDYYVKHGGKTVFLARFLPILRTFAPFIAGLAKMERRLFVLYSVGGSVAWMTLFLGAGYGFGNIPWVQKNFSVVIMAILVVSVLPAVYAGVKNRYDASRGTSAS